jgi:hypothetical protein
MYLVMISNVFPGLSVHQPVAALLIVELMRYVVAIRAVERPIKIAVLVVVAVQRVLLPRGVVVLLGVT